MQATIENAVGIGAALVVALLAGFASAGSAAAQVTESRCLAIAQSAPTTLPVNFVLAQEGLRSLAPEEVSIRFVGHATFLITTPKGVTIATDYDGYAGTGVVPRVATMNHAHTSHYTDTPDPRIEYVLRGWNPEGGKAVYRLEVEDVLIRNVTTDIRGFDGTVIPDGNSIFIFEVAGLCIGHLGHLHQVLTPDDLGLIGQLDVVMVPVDGSYTMSQDAMMETLKVLKARLILPMHYFTPATLARFVSHVGEDFAVETSPVPETTVSIRTLPTRPTVRVLPGH